MSGRLSAAAARTALAPRRGRGTALWPVLALALAMVGCGTPRGLYHWGPYEEVVHAGFLNPKVSVGERIAMMEEGLQDARKKKMAVPPGYHAQLAVLYQRLGDLASARLNIDAERRLYPESANYLDRLVRAANPDGAVSGPDGLKGGAK